MAIDLETKVEVKDGVGIPRGKLSPVHRIFFAAESLFPGKGGICRVARLMMKALSEEAEAGHLKARGVVLSDDAPPEDSAFPIRTARRSRLRFLADVWKHSLKRSHYLYDFVGVARAHCRLFGLRRPFMTFIHGIEVWENTRPDRIRWAQRADLLLANSLYTRERADNLHGGLGHAHVCWLGTEEDHPPEERAPRSGRPTVLILGRLDARQNRKGHKELMDAWPRVLSAAPDARLVIVGDGTARPALQKYATSLPEGSVEFRGFVPDSEMDSIWQETTVFAMPSRGEGFGLVYAEAMRYGIPVIASIHDAGREINVDGVTGFNVNLDKPEELAERLIELVRNREAAVRMGAAGRQRWFEHFRFSAFRDRFLGIIRPWLVGQQGRSVSVARS